MNEIYCRVSKRKRNCFIVSWSFVFDLYFFAPINIYGVLELPIIFINIIFCSTLALQTRTLEAVISAIVRWYKFRLPKRRNNSNIYKPGLACYLYSFSSFLDSKIDFETKTAHGNLNTVCLGGKCVGGVVTSWKPKPGPS